MKILETSRLILREIRLDDLDEIFKMNGDPEVMKYVGDGSVRTYEQMLQEMVCSFPIIPANLAWEYGQPF